LFLKNLQVKPVLKIPWTHRIWLIFDKINNCNDDNRKFFIHYLFPIFVPSTEQKMVQSQRCGVIFEVSASIAAFVSASVCVVLFGVINEDLIYPGVSCVIFDAACMMDAVKIQNVQPQWYLFIPLRAALVDLPRKQLLFGRTPKLCVDTFCDCQILIPKSPFSRANLRSFTPNSPFANCSLVIQLSAFFSPFRNVWNVFLLARGGIEFRLSVDWVPISKM